ncbi:MAG: DUF3298 domain-containing protein [Oscillibacter sp.]|nr:DUF3298 domain-containing protein [Oscillibacter sp.]
MKKRMILLMAAMVCLLTACGAKEAPAEPLAPPEQSVELPPPPPEEKETIRYTVSTDTLEETVRLENGTVLLTSRYSLPVLNAHREDGSVVAEAETEKEAAALETVGVFNEAFITWTDEEDYEGDLAETAAADYAWRTQEGIEWVGNYAVDLSCTAYQTERMVSVSGLYYSYTGGAHGNSGYLSWNFDLENGAFFGPELLGGGAELQTAVTEELIRQCEAKAEESGLTAGELLWQDYEAILADWQSAAISFDENGMTISYSPYELAAYAAGAQIFEIPYEFLKPYLSLQGLEVLGLAEEPGA